MTFVDDRKAVRLVFAIAVLCGIGFAVKAHAEREGWRRGYDAAREEQRCREAFARDEAEHQRRVRRIRRGATPKRRAA